MIKIFFLGDSCTEKKGKLYVKTNLLAMFISTANLVKLDIGSEPVLKINTNGIRLDVS